VIRPSIYTKFNKSGGYMIGNLVTLVRLVIGCYLIWLSSSSATSSISVIYLVAGLLLILFPGQIKEVKRAEDTLAGQDDWTRIFNIF
jgi:energy-coupling factor transporter transmembrane protein EcfT